MSSDLWMAVVTEDLLVCRLNQEINRLMAVTIMETLIVPTVWTRGTTTLHLLVKEDHGMHHPTLHMILATRSTRAAFHRRRHRGELPLQQVLIMAPHPTNGDLLHLLRIKITVAALQEHLLVTV